MSRPNPAAQEIVARQRLDDRALRILTDGLRHTPQAIGWALRRNPFMASFTAGELALAQYEVHRT